MQSSGGIAALELAARQPVRTVLSGPAGGVVGAAAMAKRSGLERIIAFDMGGTSTDVSLIDGSARAVTEGEVAGLPIGVPMLDIHTVGAGGGSLARFDAAGALRVGPESAGAMTTQSKSFIDRHGLWTDDEQRQAEEIKLRAQKEKLQFVRLAWADPHGAAQRRDLL